MVAKLRRLADCLEHGKQFQIQIAGERISIPAKAIFNIENEREGDLEEVEFQFKRRRKKLVSISNLLSRSDQFLWSW